MCDRLRLGLSVENLLNARYKYHASGIYGFGKSVNEACRFSEARIYARSIPTIHIAIPATKKAAPRRAGPRTTFRDGVSPAKMK